MFGYRTARHVAIAGYRRRSYASTVDTMTGSTTYLRVPNATPLFTGLLKIARLMPVHLAGRTITKALVINWNLELAVHMFLS